jgi:hypothetical protein
MKFLVGNICKFMLALTTAHASAAKGPALEALLADLSKIQPIETAAEDTARGSSLKEAVQARQQIIKPEKPTVSKDIVLASKDGHDQKQLKEASPQVEGPPAHQAVPALSASKVQVLKTFAVTVASSKPAESQKLADTSGAHVAGHVQVQNNAAAGTQQLIKPKPSLEDVVQAQGTVLKYLRATSEHKQKELETEVETLHTELSQAEKVIKSETKSLSDAVATATLATNVAMKELHELQAKKDRTDMHESKPSVISAMFENFKHLFGSL